TLLRTNIPRITDRNPRIAAGARLPSTCIEAAFATDQPTQGHCTNMFGDGRNFIFRSEKIPGIEFDWKVISVKDYTEAFAAVNHTRNLMLLVGAICVILTAIVGVLLALSISKPITKMTETMHELAGGNKTVDIPSLGARDEIGDMAKAVQVFKENAIRVDNMAKEQKEAMLKVADDFDKSVGGIVSSVASAATELQSTAVGMSAIIEETGKQAAAGASASEQAAGNVQTMATAAEELASSVNEILRQVSESSNISKAAVKEVEATNQTMNTLSQSAVKIGEVVDLIKDIADQTNLLALNATIEAARAGEAGKGFAVVANEVKSLANQTGKATEEISTQVEDVQKIVQNAVEAINLITNTINRMSEISSAISAAVEEQGSATQEISRSAQHAAVGAQEISSNVNGISTGAQEAGKNSANVAEAASDLARMGESLRQQVTTFLNTIRAGSS
ncbi:MAG: methyl-accepting chemotaxis protein, partial [Alphaproteobacteria bacterium]|nr:methyl-accepting chemotaxis protein [Alphaproteobacteria bacterium]